MQVTRGYGLLEKFLAEKRAHLADSLIPEESRKGKILDIGCGTFPFFLHHIRFAEKFGVDQVIDDSTDDGDHINLTPLDVCTCDTLPFADSMFDTVTMLAVFEHIEPVHLPVLIREIRRVLKPGGHFIMTTPAAWSDALLKFLANIRLISSHEMDEHKDAYTHAKIAAILDKGGFAATEIESGYFECFLNLWCCAVKTTE